MQPTQSAHPESSTQYANTFAYLAPEGTYSDEAARIFAQKIQHETANKTAPQTEATHPTEVVHQNKTAHPTEATYHTETAHPTEVAATKTQHDLPKFVPCPSFNEIYEAVERGKCEYGVLPLENSLEGAVTGTLDIFAFKSGISIVGSTVIDVHHCLLLHPQASLTDIHTITSHPQALAQCRRYLNEHFPAVKRLSASSTATAAKKASEDLHTAAIASSFAGELFGCKFAEVGIEDHVGNQTQFVLIARMGHPAVITGNRYTTSLALYLGDDRPGALLMILAEFAYANVNLTKIQSRPTKQGLGNYMFFVDIDGKQDEPQVKTALDCLRMKLQEVRVLGTYPVD